MRSFARVWGVKGGCWGAGVARMLECETPDTQGLTPEIHSLNSISAVCMICGRISNFMLRNVGVRS
jgi:hypothetical protein